MADKKGGAGKDTGDSTEVRILIAARNVFHRKGYAATRTRDIAEEAGINLALLNYYYRSKEKLFEMIMIETLQGFFQSIAMVFNEKDTSFEMKVEGIVTRYIDWLLKNPDVPLFIMSELRAGGGKLLQHIKVKDLLPKSEFLKQYQQGVKEGKISPVNWVHLILNITGLTIFPFVASPMIRAVGDLQPGDFEQLMQERKKLIPKWIKSILKTK